MWVGQQTSHFWLKQFQCVIIFFKCGDAEKMIKYCRLCVIYSKQGSCLLLLFPTACSRFKKKPSTLLQKTELSSQGAMLISFHQPCFSTGAVKQAHTSHRRCHKVHIFCSQRAPTDPCLNLVDLIFNPKMEAVQLQIQNICYSSVMAASSDVWETDKRQTNF